MQTIRTLLTDTVARLETDARPWGISRRGALMLALFPVFVAGAVALLAVLAVVAKTPFRPVFRVVTAEDSFLEWPQFFLVLAASLIFGITGVRLLRGGQWLAGLIYLLLALGSFFVAGEEISWGQRVFGWSTPDSLDAINHQGETNVHNIRLVQRVFSFAVLLGSAYGVAAPLLRQRLWPKADRPDFAWLYVPPLCLIPAFFMPFAYRMAHTFVYSGTNFVVVKYGEAPELCLYFGMAVFAWLNLRRLLPVTRRAPAVASPASQRTP